MRFYELEIGWGLRSINDKNYLVGHNCAVELNETSMHILQELESGKGDLEIVKSLAEIFDIGDTKLEFVQDDVVEFIVQLLSEGALVEVS